MKSTFASVLVRLAAVVSVLASVQAFVQPSIGRSSIQSIYAEAEKPAAAEKEPVDSFKKADFIAAVSAKTGFNKKQSEAALQAVLDVVQEQVSMGKRVNLGGFGTFTLKERAARKGRNPQTGEELQIAASKSPGFSAAKAWKDTVNGKPPAVRAPRKTAVAPGKTAAAPSTAANAAPPADK
jgi:DNA-binding protein HU-beta